MTKEELKRHCEKTCKMFMNGRTTTRSYAEHRLVLDLLEQTEWIPVSDMDSLPKDDGWYQCTVLLDDLSVTMDLYYKRGKWLDNRRIDMFNTYDIYGYGNTTEQHKLSYQELISEFDWTKNVVAWKPLSHPYKVESEDMNFRHA